MKKEEEEEPKEYIERNVLFVIVILAIGLLLDWLCVYMLINVNPWGTLVGVPAITLTLQGLWLLVNPYAIIFENRFEIKQSLIYNREFYYLDAKAIELKNKTNFVMTYNDGDLQSLPLLGVRETQKQLFLDKIKLRIAESVKGRDF